MALSREPHYLKNENSMEETPLVEIEPSPPLSWWQWGKDKLANIGLKGLALATAFPNFINGTMAHMNRPASDFINPGWWKALSAKDLSLTVAQGSAALIINVILNLYFLPLAAKKFHYQLTHFAEHPLRNLTAMLFGFMGAIGAGAIAYEAFNLFPGTAGEIFASSAAGVNFIIYIATRYVGVSNALEKFFNLFDPTLKAQHQFADLLDHIKPEYKEEINNGYLSIAQPLLENYEVEEKIRSEDLNRLTQELAFALADFLKNHPDLFLDKTKTELFLQSLASLFDLTLASSIFFPITLTFMQAGFNGINKIAELSLQQSLADWNGWGKRALGLFPGLASGALYMVSNLEMRITLTTAIRNLQTNPSISQFALLITLFTTTILSTSSMKMVANNVLHNPDNIAFIPNNSYGELYVALNQVGGFGVNFNATAKQLFALNNPGSARHLHTLSGFKQVLKSPEPKWDAKTLSLSQELGFFNPKNSPSSHDEIELRLGFSSPKV